MAHAIEMIFDDQADVKVRRIWGILASAGLPSLATRTHRRHRPHVSLTVCESLDGADLTPLRSLLAGRRPLLRLHMLGTFPGAGGVFFLGMPVTAALLALHSQVHQALAGQPVRHWPGPTTCPATGCRTAASPRTSNAMGWPRRSGCCTVTGPSPPQSPPRGSPTPARGRSVR